MTDLFPFWKWKCVPNVFIWNGKVEYEADIICVSPAGWAHEVEVKITAADLRADRLKEKWTNGLPDRIRFFSYAIPQELVPVAQVEVPESFGIIVVSEKMFESEIRAQTMRSSGAAYLRKPRKRPEARRTTDSELTRLLHKGTMRYWHLMRRSEESKS